MGEPNPYGDGVTRVSTTLSGVDYDGGEGLVAWAANLARQGKSWRAERDFAAAVGTAAHTVAERFLLNELWHETTTPAYDVDRARELAAAFLGEDEMPANGARAVTGATCSFLDFVRRTLEERDVEVLSLERKMIWRPAGWYEQCGGTSDAVFRINGCAVIADWKTSSAIRARYKVQLAAYDDGARATGIVDAREDAHWMCVRLDKKGGCAEIDVVKPEDQHKLRALWQSTATTYRLLADAGMR